MLPWPSQVVLTKRIWEVGLYFLHFLGDRIIQILTKKLLVATKKDASWDEKLLHACTCMYMA